MLINIQNIHIQRLASFSHRNIVTDILRLDLLHPVVSGNKWFKLNYYLQDAASKKATTLASFGGAYSNHIVALAYAGLKTGLTTIGFIRGEKNEVLSPTLQEAMSYGMQLIFISRSEYRNKEQVMQQYAHHLWYWIPEGGYGTLGARGAATILDIYDTSSYSHIICATGTGTMMAGLIQSARPDQEVIGISILKQHLSIRDEVNHLLLSVTDPIAKFQCVHGYDFGGYAKHPHTLLQFIRSVWEREQIPTDIVYTSKMLYAVEDLIPKGFFPENSKLLLVHSGGLQGNRSLQSGTLPF